jgi:hypothetical protein
MMHCICIWPIGEKWRAYGTAQKQKYQEAAVADYVRTLLSIRMFNRQFYSML